MDMHKRFSLNCAESPKQSPLRQLAILTGLALVAAVLACAQAPQFTFGSNQSSITWTCKMDSDSPASCTSPQNYSQQSSGSHTFTLTGSFTVPANYQNTVLADSPSEYLRLNETSGTTANDSSTGGHGGWYVNGTVGASGPINGDTAFNIGTNGYVDTSYNPFTSGSSRTYEGWAYASSTPSAATLFSSDLAPASHNPWLYFDSGSQISFYPQNSAKVSWTYTWPVNQWVMWDLTYNDSTKTAELFINGVSQGAKTATQGYYSTPGNIEWGAGAQASCFFEGAIGQVAVYPSILSSARILAHYQAAPGPVAPQFTFGSNQPGTTWTCKMDSGSPVSCSSPVSYGTQSAGSHTFTLTGTYTVSGSSTYQQTVLADGPLQYLRMNESSGTTAIDSSGNSRNGTYVNAILGIAGPVSGDTAVNLSNAGYVDASFNPFAVNSSRTFEIWAMASGTPSDATIFSSDLAPASTNPWLCFTNSTTIAFYPQNSANVTWTYTMPLNKWVLFDLTYNDSTKVADLFINGVDQGSKTVSQGYNTTTGNLEWGAGAGSSWFWPSGGMGEAAVYAGILSSTRIQAHYNDAFGETYQQAVAADSPSEYLRMNESSGSTANDSSGNSHNGTYVGGTLGVTGPVSGDTADNMGGSGYVDTAYNPFASGSSRTFEVWAQTPSAPSDATLFSSDLHPASTNPWLFINSGNVTFEPQNSASVSWTYSMPTSTWVMFDLAYNDSTKSAQLYINGVDQGAKTVSQGYNSTTGTLEWGAGAGSSWFWPGAMGEAAVYPSILSSTRILAHYNAAGSGSGGGGSGGGGGTGGGGTGKGILGVKYWDGTVPVQVMPASSLNVINATAEQLYYIGSTTCPSNVAPGSAAELDTGNYYNLNLVPCAVQVTGGNGGWYSIGCEPEDYWSDNTDPQTFATQLHGYVAAIRALDPSAHFVGPNLTTWTTSYDSSYPWGSPETWLQTMYNDYETTYGTKPPYDVLSVHCYIDSTGNTVFNGPQPYMQMLNNYSSAAVSYGYPSTIWMSEGGVFFNQSSTQALSSAQIQQITKYVNDMLTGPVGRLYYFQGGPHGWDDGSNFSVKGVFDGTNGYAVTDAGTAVKAGIP